MRHVMRVWVSQRNIDEGTPGISAACPIALALRDAGIFASIGFHNTQIQRAHGYGISPAINSKETKRFISAFDTSQHVEPFMAEIYVDE